MIWIQLQAHLLPPIRLVISQIHLFFMPNKISIPNYRPLELLNLSLNSWLPAIYSRFTCLDGSKLHMRILCAAWSCCVYVRAGLSEQESLAWRAETSSGYIFCAIPGKRRPRLYHINRTMLMVMITRIIVNNEGVS
jgi:hypothetical protein